eukprot:TRINITY_DN7667_c0_g1_i1.p2 TRINITY_DN7667_c0_g1~~TRINITY_DN7667_c0_g1_i1.p2  ORF type:complete len:186 (+),score=37.64 TRINITY_DN7667_c0_g1_i1:232-789(+)
MTAGSEHGAAPDASVRVPDYEILDYIAARKPSIEHDGSRDRPEPSDQAKPIETFDAGLPGQVAGDPFDSDSHYDDDNRSEDDRSDYGAHADPQPPVPGLADLSSSAESNSTLASSGIVPDFDHVAEGKAEYDATVPSSPAHGPVSGSPVLASSLLLTLMVTIRHIFGTGPNREGSNSTGTHTTNQ